MNADKEDIQCKPEGAKFFMHEDTDVTSTSATGVMEMRSTDPIFKAYTKQEFEIKAKAGISYYLAPGPARENTVDVTI